MESSTTSQSVAPSCVIRGPGAWNRSLPHIAQLGDRPLLLGRSPSTRSLRQRLLADIEGTVATVASQELDHDCCEEDLDRVGRAMVHEGCNAVVAIGGGKVLDAGKLLAHRHHLPCITVPTSASTCAGWTALANLYSSDGAFRSDVCLDRCPDLLVFDHHLIRLAPRRTLASGVADAMAKLSLIHI